MKTPVIQSATNILAKMKLVLLQSLDIRRIVVSVNPLPHRLITAIVRRNFILRIIIEFAAGTCPAALLLPVSAVFALTVWLKLACNCSDITTSVVVCRCTIEHNIVVFEISLR